MDKIKDLGFKIKGKRQIRMLDLGTGSGCIIITLAKVLETKVTFAQRKGDLCPIFYASDISQKALTVAKQNAKDHKVSIKFIQSDLFGNVKMKFDIIIANLPYVPEADLRLRIKDNRELQFEPKNALTDGTNEFNIYERFFQQIGTHLAKPANGLPTPVIYLEIDPKAEPFIQKWTNKYLLGAKVTFYKDLNRLIRFSIIHF